MEGVTFILVHTLRHLSELLILSAGDDVGANAVVATVAFGTSLVRVIILKFLVNDVAILELWEVKAPLARACGLRS